MLKTVVINSDKEIVKIGNWDYLSFMLDDREIITNPLPEGYQVVERDLEFDSVSQSWVEIGKLTDKERIKQLEDMIITILGVF